VDLADFDYDLPSAAIAQLPAKRRDGSRLLAVDRGRQTWTDRRFTDLPRLLRPGDCVVVNNSRVVPARVAVREAPGGAEIELLFVSALTPTRWEVLARPARRVRAGVRLEGAGGACVFRVIELGEAGSRVVESESGEVLPLLERHGAVPLPPYIAHYAKPGAIDRERYQTVYADPPGSVAAPTAGLHFTPRLLDEVRAAGVEVHALTLHVGPATFRPIRTARVETHRLAPERTLIPVAAAEAVNRARADGRRVVAVGTTTTRALEGAADGAGRVRPLDGPVGLYIVPGHRFTVVDALVTNFHVPRSSLLVLVAAFAGRELVLAAYRHAIAAGYRFYSYGDAMLIT
jgi:S-adenosylmethionine:tRNA ribosyltransferase-isomerase